MHINSLKPYNKYKHIDNPNIEYIYIGIDSDNEYYCFLYKSAVNLPFSYLKNRGLNPDKIVKDLNLEIINEYGEKCIKGCYYLVYSKENVEEYLKPILKDKLNNIINR